jgi:ribosome-binding factor A
MAETGVRARRVAEGIRAHLTSALRRDVADPRLAGLVLTDVHLPDDLGVAHVRVRSLKALDEKGRRQTIRALERATGRLKRELGRALSLKRTPELRFEFDTGPDAAERVEALLREIAVEGAVEAADE